MARQAILFHFEISRDYILVQCLSTCEKRSEDVRHLAAGMLTTLAARRQVVTGVGALGAAICVDLEFRLLGRGASYGMLRWGGTGALILLLRCQFVD